MGRLVGARRGDRGLAFRAVHVMSALLSVACKSCWDCWPITLAAFVLGSWFGILILALLVVGREDRKP
jgi:hypothetical protein